MFNSRSSISISTFLSSLIGSIMRGRRSVRCGQTCEYRKARLILTHDPGEELFLGALHPAAALFREHIDIPELIAEHATYRKVLEEAGARVLTVRQILLRRNRRGRETRRPDEAGEPAPLRGRFSYLRHPKPLSGNSRAAKGVPTIHPRQDIAPGSGADYSATTDHPTVGNADQHGAQGRIFGKPRDESLLYAGPVDNHSQRHRNRTHELPAAGERMRHSAILPRKIGMKPLHRIEGEGAHLEGGDFYPFGDTAFIGCGMRTTQPAIDQLMEHDLLGCNRLVVVKDRLFSQAEMHLDTYFNIIDRNLVTLTARRMTTDPDSPDLLLADIYLRGANGVYTKTEEDVGFVELLRSRIGAAIIPISEEDADRLAGNFLTVGSRRIIGVAGQSEALRTELKHRGVKVTWVGLDNLCKGYGAAHCMTQVLRRR